MQRITRNGGASGMSLLAVYSLNEEEQFSPVNVLAFTERHHIINDSTSFLDFELLIVTKQDSREVSVLCDRAIQPLPAVKDRVAAERAYKASSFLTLLDNAGNLHGDRIFDFQKTAKWGPGYNTRSQRSFRAKSELHENISIRTRPQNSFTEVLISRNDGRNWSAGVCYQLRLGFFVAIPASPPILNRFFFRYYNIHLLAFDRQFRTHLEDRGLLKIVRQCSALIRMSPKKGLAPVTEALSNNPSTDLAELTAGLDLEYPHSGVWILVDRDWIVRRRPGKESPEPSGVPSWLLFDSPNGLGFFRLYRWFPGSSPSYSNALLNTRENDTFDLILTTWWLRPVVLYPLIVATISLSIGIFNATHSLLASIIAGIVTLAAYLGIQWIARRYNLPSWPPS